MFACLCWFMYRSCDSHGYFPFCVIIKLVYLTLYQYSHDYSIILKVSVKAKFWITGISKTVS